MAHIAYIHQYFATPDSTTGTRSYHMARRLVQAGHHVEILSGDSQRGTPAKSTAKVYTEAIDGITVVYRSVPYSQSFSAPRRLWSWLRFAIWATQYLLRHARRFDIAYVSSTPLTVTIPALILRRLRGLPFIFEVRDLWPDVPISLGELPPILRPMARKLAQWSYDSAERIICLSPDMAEGVLDRYSPQASITVVPNGCSPQLREDPLHTLPEWWHRLNLDDRLVVTYAGTLGRVNAPEYLADIAASLSELHSQIAILVLGAGSERSRMLARAADAGVLGINFFYHPPVPQFVAMSVLGASHVGVSTTRAVPELWANSANKVFDAFSVGTPVAVNHPGWIGRLLEETGAGVVLDSHCPRRAAHSLSQFVSGPEYIRACRAARTLARDVFNWDLLAAQVSAEVKNSLSSQVRVASARR